MPLRDLDIAILCGGKGTRAKPFLGDTPKVLAPINGRPVIELILDRLKAHGAKRVTLCAGYLANKLVAWKNARESDGLEIELSIEDEQRGGRHALKMFANTKPYWCGLFAVWNGDTIIDGDLSSLWLVREPVSFSVRGVPCGLSIMSSNHLDFPLPQWDATGLLDFTDIGTPEGYALAQERYK